jgi:hypothetical protein
LCSPRRRRIFTAFADSTAQIWDGSGKPLATFQGYTGAVMKAEAPRCLTPEQRRAFFIHPEPPRHDKWRYDTEPPPSQSPANAPQP